ncbi:MAG: type II toxin-antitoxin system Phd/YefM family antitoxin [Ardenticatenaceae bacterium]
MTNSVPLAVTMSSNKARQHWSNLLNATLQGKTTVIERYGGPIAVVIPYYEWVKQQTPSQNDQKQLHVTTGNDEVTDALNQVYGAESGEMDSALIQMQMASLDGETW